MIHALASRFKAYAAMRIRRPAGFTLIELMIVVVIVAILAAFAIPAYQRYVYRSRRPDGKDLLIRLAQAEELYYTTHNSYPVTAASLDPGLKLTSEKGYYVAVINVPNPNPGAGPASYRLDATALGPQVPDVCGVLMLDNTGLKTPIATAMPQNSNGLCW
ncbi:MAG: type IV pilin protein [Rhodanobacteraceae bacterium]